MFNSKLHRSHDSLKADFDYQMEIDRIQKQINDERRQLIGVHQHIAQRDIEVKDKRMYERNRPTEVLTKATNDLFSTMNQMSEYARYKSTIAKEWDKSVMECEGHLDAELDEANVKVQELENKVSTARNLLQVLENELSLNHEQIQNNQTETESLLQDYKFVQTAIEQCNIENEKHKQHKKALDQEIEENNQQNDEITKSISKLEDDILHEKNALKVVEELVVKNEQLLATGKTQNQHDAKKVSEIESKVQELAYKQESKRQQMVAELANLHKVVEFQMDVSHNLQSSISHYKQHSQGSKTLEDTMSAMRLTATRNKHELAELKRSVMDAIRDRNRRAGIDSSSFKRSSKNIPSEQA